MLMNRRTMLLAGGATLATAGTKVAVGQHPTRLESRVAASAETRGFCGAILVQSGDRIVFDKHFGPANIPFSVPNSPGTRYKIASVTKLFTAVLIMQLVEQKRLTLADTIGMHLPSYSGAAKNKVNIFQLLTATSGIPDFGRNNGEAYSRKWTPDEIVERFCGGNLEFVPGSKFRYNNADYYLLGRILEATYKNNFAGILSAQILRLLKMESTGMADTATIIPRLACPYMRDRQTDALSNDPPYFIENYGAAGAMYSSPRDLLAFSNALYGKRIVKADTLRRMLTPNLANYAFGQWIFHRSLDNIPIRMAERQGSIQSVGARFVRLLDYDATIIIIANIWPRNMDMLERDIVQELVAPKP